MTSTSAVPSHCREGCGLFQAPEPRFSGISGTLSSTVIFAHAPDNESLTRMRNLAFGTVRRNRSTQLKWLDTHNMVGIVTLGWVSVVGLIAAWRGWTAP